MGDRTWWVEKCPKCGADIEVYDAPSCLQWCCHCTKCGYDDGLNYYEAPENCIVLCTREKAVKKGLIMNCPICKKDMTWWERDKYKMCIMCHQIKKSNEERKLATKENS